MGYVPAIIGFTIMVVIWLPLLLCGVVAAILERPEEDVPEDPAFTARCKRVLDAVTRLEQVRAQSEQVLEDLHGIRARLDRGESGAEVEVYELQRRHDELSLVVSNALISIMENFCLGCRGRLRVATSEEGLGAWCTACSRLFRVDRISEIVKELKRNKIGIWGLKPRKDAT
jgi:hypothetical protein